MTQKNTTTIKHINNNLDGIAIVNNTPVAVPFTNINSTVQILQVNPKNNIATQYNIISNPNTNPPICKHYTICGGCKAQHFNVDTYNQLKTNKLLNAFKNYSNLQHFNSSNINYISYLNQASAKRRRAIFSVSNNQIGFMQYKSNKVAPIDNCPLLTPTINNILQVLQQILNNNVLNLSQIIINNPQNQTSVTLVAKHKPTTLNLLALQPLYNLNLNHIAWQSASCTTTLASNGNIMLNYSGHNVQFSNSGFLQALEQTETNLQQLVLQTCNHSKNVVDLFCGFGGYAFTLSNQTNIKQITCYDIDKKAIENINNVKHSKINAFSSNLFKNPIPSNILNKFDTAIINPPRAGASQQIQQIAQSNISKVAMVYCSALACANNLSTLLNAGFKVNNITILDQFIYSPHIEIFVDLAK